MSKIIIKRGRPKNILIATKAQKYKSRNLIRYKSVFLCYLVSKWQFLYFKPFWTYS